MKDISFRKVIIFAVLTVNFIFFLILFQIFNNFYFKNTMNKFIEENKYSSTVTKDFIEGKKEALLKQATAIGAADRIVCALRFNKLIYSYNIIRNLSEDENVMENIKVEKLSPLKYMQMINVEAERLYGSNITEAEGRGLALYSKYGDGVLKKVASTRVFPKKFLDTGEEHYLQMAVGELGKSGADLAFVQNIDNEYYIKSIFNPNKLRGYGVVVNIEELGNNTLAELKKIINKEVFLIKNDVVVTSTLMKDFQKYENFGIDLSNYDSKSNFAETRILGKRMGISLVPVKGYDEATIGYIGIGFYISDLEAIYKSSMKNFIVFAIVFSIILFIVLFTIITGLFRPFKKIIDGIKFVEEGDYKNKITVSAVGELDKLVYSINTLAGAVEQRELELKEKNKQLTELDKMKDEFLANTSHELRTPLNGIIGIADSILDGNLGEVSDVISHNLYLIVSSGKRLSKLVDDILDFSKLKEREINLNLKTIDVKSVANVVIFILKPLADAKGIGIVNSIGDDIPFVKADENRLQQVLYNLVGNAIKFTKEGGVSVSAREKDGFVEISVSDTGIGITKEKFGKLFNSFEQLDGSTEREFGGTGLGLAISKNIVELHGGNIYVESEAGIGSTFSFTLKKGENKSAENNLEELKYKEKYMELKNIDDGPETVNIQSDVKILIADDEPVNQRILVNILSSKYSVVVAENGDEAVKLIDKGMNENSPFDLAILDVMMPKMSGFEASKKLREKHSAFDLPVLMLTAKNQITDIISGLDSGANDYLVKPFDKKELLARVGTLVNLKKAVKNAMENAVQYEEEKQQREFAEQLRAINTELTSTLDLTQVTKILIKHLSNFIAYTRYFTMFKHDGEYTIVDYQDESSLKLKKLKVNPAKNEFISEIENEKKPILKKLEGSGIFDVNGENLKAALGIPITYRGNIIGITIFESINEEFYNNAHLEIIFTIAGQAGVAIENARLYAKLSKMLEKLKSLEEMISVIHTEADKYKAVNYILTILIYKFGANISKAFFIESKNNMIFVDKNFYTGYDYRICAEDEYLTEDIKLPLIEESFIYGVMNNRENITYDKIENNTVNDELIKMLRLNTFAVFPIVYEEFNYGVLILNANSPEDIKELLEEEETISIFTRNVSFYLENRRLEMEELKNEKLETMVKLSSAIVHEVKTPLVGIRGFATMAKNKYKDEVRIQNYMDTIIKESDRVDEMASQLLEYSGRSEVKYKFEPSNLSEIMDLVLHEKSGDIEANGISIIKNYKSDKKANVDKVQMEKVFKNLVKNCIEASKGFDDSIEITIEDEGDMQVVKITDFGSGIKEEIKEKIFEPLITTKIQGTGLGLPIVKSRITAHNADIEIKTIENPVRTIAELKFIIEETK